MACHVRARTRACPPRRGGRPSLTRRIPSRRLPRRSAHRTCLAIAGPLKIEWDRRPQTPDRTACKHNVQGIPAPMNGGRGASGTPTRTIRGEGKCLLLDRACRSGTSSIGCGCCSSTCESSAPRSADLISATWNYPAHERRMRDGARPRRKPDAAGGRSSAYVSSRRTAWRSVRAFAAETMLRFVSYSRTASSSARAASLGRPANWRLAKANRGFRRGGGRRAVRRPSGNALSKQCPRLEANMRPRFRD